MAKTAPWDRRVTRDRSSAALTLSIVFVDILLLSFHCQCLERELTFKHMFLGGTETMQVEQMEALANETVSVKIPLE